MQSSSGYVFGIGIGMLLLSVLNHFVLKFDPIAHTTKIAFALGMVIMLAGAALAIVGSTKPR